MLPNATSVFQLEVVGLGPLMYKRSLVQCSPLNKVISLTVRCTQGRISVSAFQLPVSSDLYRPICYQFRMGCAHGLFLSQPITTLENISYILLAQ